MEFYLWFYVKMLPVVLWCCWLGPGGAVDLYKYWFRNLTTFLWRILPTAHCWNKVRL